MKKNNVEITTGLKIEKNIPIPAAHKTSEFTETAKQMEVGDSVKVDSLPKGIYNLGKKLDFGFSSRKLESGGYRVWRIK